MIDSIYNMYNISTTYDTTVRLVNQQQQHLVLNQFCLNNPKDIVYCHSGLGLLTHI